MEAAKGRVFVAQAPVVIASCGTEIEYIMTCGQYCYPIDVAIAVYHTSLAAIGGAWVHAGSGLFMKIW
jgi:hypothetical protein